MPKKDKELSCQYCGKVYSKTYIKETKDTVFAKTENGEIKKIDNKNA